MNLKTLEEERKKKERKIEERKKEERKKKTRVFFGAAVENKTSLKCCQIQVKPEESALEDKTPQKPFSDTTKPHPRASFDHRRNQDYRKREREREKEIWEICNIHVNPKKHTDGLRSRAGVVLGTTWVESMWWTCPAKKHHNPFNN
jgi:hypothetical protein